VHYVKVGDVWIIYYVLNFKINIHPGHVLCPRWVLRKVNINKWALNQKWYSHQKQGFTIIECNNVKGFKPKMRRHKLREAINWPITLKQILIKQLGIKQGLGVIGIYQSPFWKNAIHTDVYHLSM